MRHLYYSQANLSLCYLSWESSLVVDFSKKCLLSPRRLRAISTAQNWILVTVNKQGNEVKQTRNRQYVSNEIMAAKENNNSQAFYSKIFPAKMCNIVCSYITKYLAHAVVTVRNLYCATKKWSKNLQILQRKVVKATLRQIFELWDQEIQ